MSVRDLEDKVEAIVREDFHNGSVFEFRAERHGMLVGEIVSRSAQGNGPYLVKGRFRLPPVEFTSWTAAVFYLKAGYAEALRTGGGEDVRP